jgi:glycosyltransferase involved in cell wall biosynthesis
MPALNEEEGIAKAIQSIPIRKMRDRGYEVEILVIDGGSKDRTVELAGKAGATVIIAERGYGRQYKKGFREAKGEIIVTGDSDGSYPFEDVLSYIEYLEKSMLDFITLNRFAKMEKDAMHISNKIGNFGLTLFTDLFFGLRLKDSQSGMWVIRKRILEKLNLTSNGMPFSQEIKIEAFRKVKSAEIPGKYRERLGETKLLKIKDGFGNLFALLVKRFSSRLSSY